MERQAEFEFNVIETMVKTTCFLCSFDIIPGEDYWTTVISLRPKKQTLSTHNACFEFFAWSATNFVFKTAREEKVGMN